MFFDNFEQQFIEVLLAIVKSKFTFFKMQIKSGFIHATKFRQACFGKSPKPFDAIDVSGTISKFILSMIDAKMLSIPNIHESIVATPTIGVDHAFQRDTAPDDGLQRGFGAIRHNFCVDFSVALENTKDDCFARSAPASFSFNPPGSKKTFIDFNFSGKRRLCFAKFSDAFSYSTQIAVD